MTRPARTALTSYTPRPETTAATSRTIDNAGFVDNGGRTSDETTRTQMSGARATELGSERPTGTPGSGLPIPLPGDPPIRSAGEMIEGGRTPTASPRGELLAARTGVSVEVSSRVASARCDWATACNHVGTGQLWGSQESCRTNQREQAAQDFSSLSCDKGVDPTQLGMCLNAIRKRPCGDRGPELSSISECRSTALCSP